MNDNINRDNDLKVLSMDETQVKMISEKIREYASELEDIRNHAELMWEKCSVFLDDNIMSSINSVKEGNKKKYKAAHDNLKSYADRIDSIANIWKDTEAEIKSSSVDLENLFAELGRTISSVIGKDNNQQN